MNWIARIGVALIALFLLVPTVGAQAGGIAWSKDLNTALAQAKAKKKILMVCINAKSVDGRTGLEPAAKALREVIYKDPRIVGRSRAFVCVMLTKEGSSTEYDALRKLHERYEHGAEHVDDDAKLG